MSKIGAQLFTLRDYLKTPEDIDKSFEKLAKIGYTAMQASGFDLTTNPSLIRELADKHGLKIINTHYPLALDGSNLEKAIADHKILGAEYVGLGALPPSFISEKGFAEFAEKFDKLAVELKKEGLGLTYHNHQVEFLRYNGKTGFEIMLENSENFTFLLDTYWVQFAGKNPALMISELALANRIELVHYKDMAVESIPVELNPYTAKQIMAPVGEGNIDWASVDAAVESAGIKYCFVEQDDCNGDDPFECMEKSFKNMQSRGFEF